MPAMGDLGTLVRTRRTEEGLTLQELAALVGVSHQAISLIELGKATGMKAVTARRLARALKVDTDVILDLLELTPAPLAV